MKSGLRNACVSSAVIATLYGPTALMARDLLWDPTGVSAGGTDGGGTWTTGINPNTNAQDMSWVDPSTLPTPTNVTWSNAIPDSGTFGISTAAVNPVPTALTVLLGSNITVNNWTMASASTGAAYNFFDQGDGAQTLTLAGNIQKTSSVGTPQVLFTNAISLTAGNHIIALRDSPGNAPAELTFNSGFSGAGAITLDNTYNFGGNNTEVQFGTVVLNVDSTYTGGTNVAEGRLVANTANAMGTGPVTVSGGGSLSFGGAGSIIGNTTFTNPITVTRNDYTSSDTFNKYGAAIIAENDGSVNTITLNGPLTIDSTDARVGANTNTLIINSNIASTTGGKLTIVGDFNGFVQLNGNNTGLATGGIRFQGAQTDFTTEANLGGPTSPLQFAGGVFHPVGGVLTDFGTHPINNADFNGSIFVDDTKTFNINQPLGTSASATGSLSKRGLGTLNISKGVDLRGGQAYFDAGIVNIINDGTAAVGTAPASGTVNLQSLHLRSATFNVPAGTTLSTINQYSSLGQDTTGTNGNPDSGTLNIAGTGTFGDSDFNISDNIRTTGALNVTGAGVVTIAGTAYAGKGNNALATVTLSDTSSLSVGTTAAARNLVIGQNGATGSLTKSSTGTLSVSGEFQVGNNLNGVGSFTQSAGATTLNNWFATGRDGAKGTTLISGGVVTKQGGNNAYVGERDRSNTSTFTVNGTGSFVAATGEFWAGQGGGVGILNITDNGQFSVNNWLALGRANVNSYGELNLSGSASLTKTGGGFLAIGSGGTGVLTQTGNSTMTINGALVGEASSAATMNLLGGTSVFTGQFSLGANGGVSGTINLGGTHTSTMPDVVVGRDAGTGGGTFNLNGGTLTVNSIRAGSGTGAKVINWNGTQVIARTAQTNWIGGLMNSQVQAGGVKINTNGVNVTVNSALAHGTALGATVDGGLIKSGSGTLTLAGSSTYTGGTTVTNGVLELAAIAQTPVLGTGAAGVNIQNGAVQFDYTGTSPVATIRGLLAASFQAPTTPGVMDTGTIRSSTATAARGLGYRDNGTSNVLVQAALFGDADLDGGVSINDFNALAGNFGQATGKVWVDGDFDYDGGISINDFNLLAGNFGQTLPASSEAWSGLLAFAAAHNDLAAFEAVTGVPEPTSLGLIAAGATLGLRRRRQAK